MPNSPSTRELPPIPDFPRLFTDNPRAGQKLKDFLRQTQSGVESLNERLGGVIDGSGDPTAGTVDAMNLAYYLAQVF